MIKLHKMTWGEFEKHNSAAISRHGDPDKVIPQTYWFIADGEWFSVDKGAIGWNIYDESWRNVGYVDTLSEIRCGW